MSQPEREAVTPDSEADRELRYNARFSKQFRIHLL